MHDLATQDDPGGAVRNIEVKLRTEANKLTLRFGLMWAAAVIIVALWLP